MPKSTQELANSRAGETAESNGFGAQERPLRPAGLYQLKNKAGEVVSTVIVKNHPKFGDGQAAAAERVGYEFVRAARKDEIKEIEVDSKQLATEDKAGNVTQDDLKGALARINALEKENSDLKAGKTAEDNSGSADGAVKAQAKQDAKEEAQTQLENRGQVNPTLDDEGDDLPEGDEGEGEEELTPVSQFKNKDELKAAAEAEGNCRTPLRGTHLPPLPQSRPLLAPH